MRKNILFYTDCHIFGGCEKPILEVIASDAFLSRYDFKVIFRSSDEYIKGLLTFWPSFPKSRFLGLKLFDLNTLYHYLTRKVSNPLVLKLAKKFFALIFLLITPFIFVYDFLVLSLLFSKNKADIIHINNGGYPGALSCRCAAIAAKFIRFKRIIFSVHNTALKNKRIFDWVIDYFVQHSVDVIITGSKASGLALAKNRGFDQNKMITIYHGVRESNMTPGKVISVGPESAEKYILMVASFEERKGHKYAVRAFKKIIFEDQAFADLKLVLIGDGPVLNDIKRLVALEHLDNSVRFMGHRDDYLDYLASCLFLINPSISHEDLPYIILEAMSMGVPVIGTDIAGIPEEIENGITGIIVPPGDINALTQVMLILLSEDKTRLNMGIEAKKRFGKLFTLDKMTDKYISLYNINSRNNEST